MEEYDDKIDQEPEPWYKGPIIYILSIFLLLLIVLMAVPHYGVKLDPEPKRIPSISEVIPDNLELENNTENDYLSLLKPNDPVIKQVADRIATISCDGNRICQSKAIFYFVRDNFEYVSDPVGREYIKSARETLMAAGGDCDDHAVLLANLLESIGIRTEFVFTPNHVYVKALLPEALKRYKTEDNWVNLDATCKSCSFGEVRV